MKKFKYKIMQYMIAFVLVSGMQKDGDHVLTFDGSGLASGEYFIRIQADNFVETKKLNLLK